MSGEILKHKYGAEALTISVYTLLVKYRTKLIKMYVVLAEYQEQGRGGGAELVQRDIDLLEGFVKDLEELELKIEENK